MSLSMKDKDYNPLIGRTGVDVGKSVRDNIRFGLEFEKSAFGKYNVDNAVNAGFRYSF